MKLASIAANRLEVLLSRIIGVVLIINGIEPAANGLGDWSMLNFLGQALFVAFIFSTLAGSIGGLLGNYAPWSTAHALVVFVAMLLSPLSYEQGISQTDRPWVWWALGLAAVLFGVSRKSRAGFIFIGLISVGWLFVYGTGFESNRLDVAVLDSLYLVVFAVAIVTLTDLVRDAAAEVDEANSKAIASALEQARVDAVERERQRLDALLHDQVLHSLLLAARAQTPQERSAASSSAATALTSLKRAGETDLAGEVTSLGLLTALERASRKLDPRISVRVAGADSIQIPAEVAQAITEATLQAIDNAIQHSRATKIEVKLSAKKGKLEFEIADDGTGFRLDRVSRDRIGIRTSIIARMNAVAGEAVIDSSSQAGTSVLLRWSND